MPLFIPITIGTSQLPNRIFMAPMTRLRAFEPGDVPTRSMCEYYQQRATAGLIVTEATQVSAQAKGYNGTPGIHSPEQIVAWQTITEAVHQAQGHISLQIWHTGRVSHCSVQPDGAAPFAPSAIPTDARITLKDASGQNVRTPCSEPQALSLLGIQQVIKDFASATQNAVRAGFDFVEIHGGHGYLLHQFLSPESNIRTDLYGGSIENRTRLVLEVVDAAIEAWDHAHIGVRISPIGVFNSIANDQHQAEAALYLIRALNERKIAYLHISDPFWEADAAFTQAFRQNIRSSYDGPIIYAGGYDQEKAQALLDSGLGDAVAFGRAYIANPDLVERFKAGYVLNVPDEATIYGSDDQGYIDYPTYRSPK